MTKYEQLRSAYSGFDDAVNEALRSGQFFAKHFGTKLIEYLGLPDMYKNIDGGSLPYFTFHKITDDGEVKHGSGEHFFKAVDLFSDGTFQFGVGIIMERAGNAFPKRRMLLKVVCDRYEDAMHISISEHPPCLCKALPSGEFDLEPAFDFVYQRLLEHCSRRPGDRKGPSKMGFQIVN